MTRCALLQATTTTQRDDTEYIVSTTIYVSDSAQRPTERLYTTSCPSTLQSTSATGTTAAASYHATPSLLPDLAVTAPSRPAPRPDSPQPSNQKKRLIPVKIRESTWSAF